MTVNPFVQSAIDIMIDRKLVDFSELVDLLAKREPELSPLNLECAAKEAMRQVQAGLEDELLSRSAEANAAE
jgi:hypothetical protein